MKWATLCICPEKGLCVQYMLQIPFFVGHLYTLHHLVAQGQYNKTKSLKKCHHIMKSRQMHFLERTFRGTWLCGVAFNFRLVGWARVATFMVLGMWKLFGTFYAVPHFATTNFVS